MALLKRLDYCEKIDRRGAYAKHKEIVCLALDISRKNFFAEDLVGDKAADFFLHDPIAFA